MKQRKNACGISIRASWPFRFLLSRMEEEEGERSSLPHQPAVQTNSDITHSDAIKRSRLRVTGLHRAGLLAEKLRDYPLCMV